MSGTLGARSKPVLANQSGADLYDWIALHQTEGGGARVGNR
jgi:hypothetical protein